MRLPYPCTILFTRGQNVLTNKKNSTLAPPPSWCPDTYSLLYLLHISVVTHKVESQDVKTNFSKSEKNSYLKRKKKIFFVLTESDIRCLILLIIVIILSWIHSLISLVKFRIQIILERTYIHGLVINEPNTGPKFTKLLCKILKFFGTFTL